MASTGYAYEDSRVSCKDGAEVADGRAAAFRPPNPRENRRPKRAPLHYERGGRGSVERRLRENPRSISGPQSSILNPQFSILNPQSSILNSQFSIQVYRALLLRF